MNKKSIDNSFNESIFINSPVNAFNVSNETVLKVFKLDPKEIEDKKDIFVKHYAYKKSLEILNENKKIIISGIAGVGKTTLCEQLSLHIYNKLNNNQISNKISYLKKLIQKNKSKKWNIYLFTCLNSFLKYYEHHQKNCIYFIDDIFGQISWDDDIKESDLKKLLIILEQDKNNYFLISTRENIFKNIDKFDLFPLEKIKKFLLEIEKLTTQDKADILYNHLKYYLKKENKNQALLSIIENQNYWKIIEHRNYTPRIIETITKNAQNNSNLFNTFINDLDNPNKMWLNLFQNLSDVKKTIVYIIYLLNDGMEIKKELLDYICKQILYIDYYQALYQLENSFIKIKSNGECIQLYNPSIRDFLSCYNLEQDILEKYSKVIIYWVKNNLVSKDILDHGVNVFSNGIPNNILDKYQDDIYKMLSKHRIIHISYLQCLNDFDCLKRIINEKYVNGYSNKIIFHPYISQTEKSVILSILYNKYIDTEGEINFIDETQMLYNFSSLLTYDEIKNIYDEIPDPDDIKGNISELGYYHDILVDLCEVFNNKSSFDFAELLGDYEYFLSKIKEKEDRYSDNLSDDDKYEKIIAKREIIKSNIDNKFANLINSEI